MSPANKSMKSAANCAIRSSSGFDPFFLSPKTCVTKFWASRCCCMSLRSASVTWTGLPRKIPAAASAEHFMIMFAGKLLHWMPKAFFSSVCRTRSKRARMKSCSKKTVPACAFMSVTARVRSSTPPMKHPLIRMIPVCRIWCMMDSPGTNHWSAP